jgi:hypothetical protein
LDTTVKYKMQYIPVTALEKASIWEPEDYDLGNGQRIRIYCKDDLFTFGPVVTLTEFRRWFQNLGRLDEVLAEGTSEPTDESAVPMEVEETAEDTRTASPQASTPSVTDIPNPLVSLEALMDSDPAAIA